MQAQNERENIRKRQAEGIAAAQARGVRFGRPLKKPPADFAEQVKLWECGELTTVELMRRTGLKETTLYRRLRECQAVKRV